MSGAQLWDRKLSPTDHTGGAFDLFTQRDFADVEAFLADGGSRGRPDLVPDQCQTLEDCDRDSTTDACELEAGTQEDLNYDGIPDDCEEVYGDVDGDGLVNADDLLCELDGLRGLETCPGVTFDDLDIWPCEGGGGPPPQPNVDDLLRLLDALRGPPFCPDPCP